MILILAMVLDAALGEPEWLWSRFRHPAVLIGQLIGWADTRFNRGDDQIWRGQVLIVTLVAGSLATGLIISYLPFGWLWELLLGAVLLAQRSLVDHVRAVASGLRIDLATGRETVARIVGRDVSSLDEAGVARSAIESAAENLSDGVIAPVFWFALLGLPGILAYKVINTADSMIGYRTPKHEHFGRASALLDDIVNWIPARLTAVLILAVYGRVDQWKMVIRDAKLHRSPNAGWPEAAMAGVLGVALSGPRSYEGVTRREAFVNEEGRHDLTPEDIEATCAVLWRVWAMMLVLVAIWVYFIH
ncbi:MAG: adenosylcobinamide-phosphate synthase CbiB [Litoreibacter sp.]